MRKQRGGGFFYTMVQGAAGALYPEINWGNIGLVLLLLIVIGGAIAAIVYALTKPKTGSGSSNSGPSGYPVGPPMNREPGRVDIAAIAQGPSAGQAIVYFSKHESAGTTCDTCQVKFDLIMTYTGGSPKQADKYDSITAPINAGTVMIPYGTSTSNFGPLTPGGSNTVPPTSVRINVTARVIDPTNPNMLGAPTTFSKTIPYTA